MVDVGRKIELQKAFWLHANERPVIQLRVGSIFPTDCFSVSEKLLSVGKNITPDMLNVEEFLPDYERMYNVSENISCNDSFWAAEPYAAIPWIEAMLGCRIFPGNNSFVSEPCIAAPNELGKARIDFDGVWVKKYCEFLTQLKKLSGGRFPVAQSSILRGLLDCLGAVLGQTQMIFALYDNPVEVETFVNILCDDFISLIKLQYEYINPFYGGSIADIWAPDKYMMHYQDDLTAIASPWAFERYLKTCHDKICSEFNYSYFHIHPASFMILDNLLSIENLGVVQTQKDVGGPSVDEMLPYLTRILKKKKLFFSGSFSFVELDNILEILPAAGLFLHISTDTLEDASVVSEYIKKKLDK